MGPLVRSLFLLFCIAFYSVLFLLGSLLFSYMDWVSMSFAGGAPFHYFW